MRTTALAALAALGLAASAGAHAIGFTGGLAPANWTTTISGPAFGSSVDVSTAPASITLHGGDDPLGGGCPDGTQPGFFGGCQISFTITGNAIYTFHWSYATGDITPQYDGFGMLVDGVRTQLVANGGALAQSGDATVHANSSFGWYINCSDCTGGAAMATISAVTAVPEPESVALMSLGLVALGARSLRRRRA